MAGGLDAGSFHSCALVGSDSVRCWGYSADGQLGYGYPNTIGDDETPASVGPVSFGPGRTAKAISAGAYHTCALLDDGSVRCWGYGANGRLGYGNTRSIGAQQSPGSVGAIDLGQGHTAKAISAGGAHTCAILDDGSVRCWGYDGEGELGYGNTNDVGDNEIAGSAGNVNLGLGHTAKAISAGGAHTCAILDDDSVRCWGFGQYGRLGYGSTGNVGDAPSTTPDKLGPVQVGRPAVAISAGGVHTCAVLDDGSVRCWGYGGLGGLGYANTMNIGDNETPDTSGPVKLGPERAALAISAGQLHTCALLDHGAVRCWGFGNNGRLGLGNTTTVGDLQTPDTVSPVNLGAGRSAVAISAGESHTCARLDDTGVRCWGAGANGRLGYCNQDDVGDNEAPGAAGPVNLAPNDGGAACPPAAGSSSAASAPPSTVGATSKLPLASDAVRARGLRACLAATVRHARRERGRSLRGSARQRARARRHLTRHARRGRRRCLRRYGRTPGRVTGLRARPRGKTRVELDFKAAGTDADHPPAARSYLIKQSRRPIRTARDFARSQTLCKGVCRFRVSMVHGSIALRVSDLRPRTTYYYAAVARDNVSARRGSRSQTVKASTG